MGALGAHGADNWGWKSSQGKGKKSRGHPCVKPACKHSQELDLLAPDSPLQ